MAKKKTRSGPPHKIGVDPKPRLFLCILISFLSAKEDIPCPSSINQSISIENRRVGIQQKKKSIAALYTNNTSLENRRSVRLWLTHADVGHRPPAP